MSEVHEMALPIRLIVVQLVNFLILIGILYYFLKDRVRIHFAKRSESYKDLVLRAEHLCREAEQRKNEIEQKLRHLDQMRAENHRAAEQEADELKIKLIEQAHALAQRLEQEARTAAHFEIEKAKQQMRRELIDLSFEQAYTILKNQVEEPDRQRLQNEFVEKIQVVR